MRILTPVIEIPTLPVFDPGQDLALGRAVALELIRDNHPWHVLQALQQLAEKLLRGLLVAPTLHQDVEHVVVLIDGAPQVMTLPINGPKHFVQVPLVPWLGASTLQPIRILLPKLQTPLTDGFVRHINAAFKQELLHVTVAEGEAVVEPDTMADDLAGKTVGYCWRIYFKVLAVLFLV
jgi:hypothetical protein